MTKPTIRELLDGIADDEQFEARAIELAKRVEAVLKLHFEEGPMGETSCAECFAPWPCETYRALEGER